MRCRKKVLAISTVALSLLLHAPAWAADTLVDAVKEGKPIINVRYRFESVDQDGVENNASASTLRARIGYETGSYKGFKAVVDFETIQNIGGEKFNNTVNGKTTYPVVADPETSELNQAYIAYSGIGKTSLKLGRQRIKLDNARFVGNVGFRQNEQTFDSVVFANTSIKNLTAIYAYVWNVNRIFGEDHPAGDLSTDTHIINLGYKTPYGKLSAYGLFIDLDAAAALSSRTMGVRFAGSTKATKGGFSFLYALEFANQQDNGNNPTDYDVNYYLVEAGAKYAGFTAKAGYEVLEGDGTSSFKTPLATLHTFQGVTDKFLATPPNGIEDIYVKLAYKVGADGFLKGLKISGSYHDFKAENGGGDYGSEWGVKLSRGYKTSYGKISWSAEVAKYESDGFGTDTTKSWMTLGLAY